MKYFLNVAKVCLVISLLSFGVYFCSQGKEVREISWLLGTCLLSMAPIYGVFWFVCGLEED